MTPFQLHDPRENTIEFENISQVVWVAVAMVLGIEVPAACERHTPLMTNIAATHPHDPGSAKRSVNDTFPAATFNDDDRNADEEDIKAAATLNTNSEGEGRAPCNCYR